MFDEFYVRFENSFRGDREDIKQRLKVYLPLIESLKQKYPNSEALDLGCGRGEWLELLQEDGWVGKGIDTNLRMVKICQSLGLNAIYKDALEYLKSVKDDTLSMISGFHIAEHLPFELLLELISEAHRTLLPDGILILETPNPENNVVRASSFYTDPTHRKPIPPNLMKFLAKDCGFNKTIILRLNGPSPTSEKETLSHQILYSFAANPDYGLVAQKEPGTSFSKISVSEKAKIEAVDSITALSNVITQIEDDHQKLNQQLSKNEDQQQTLHSDLAVKEDQVQTLHSDLAAKEDQLQTLKSDLAAKEDQLQTLKSDLAAKEDQLQTLQSDLAAKDEQMQTLQTDLAAKESLNQALYSELNEIKVSKAWRLAMAFRRIRHKLAPPGSLQARLFHKIKGTYDAPIFNLQRNWHYIKYKKMVIKSGFFDNDWYLCQYSDVAQSRMNPLKHYMLHGAYEDRDPGPNFNSAWYLETFQDVKESGLNPLIHYLKFGQKEGRLPISSESIELLEDMAPRTQQVYQDLLDAIEQNEGVS